MARPGTLDTLLTPRTNAPTWSAGVPSEGWTNGTAFWAEVREMSAREAMQAGQAVADLPAVVTYRADAATLSSTMQLTDGSVTYEVRSAPRRVAGPRGQYLQVLAVVAP